MQIKENITGNKTASGFNRDLADAGSGVPGRKKMGLDAWFCWEQCPGTQVFFCHEASHVYLPRVFGRIL